MMRHMDERPEPQTEETPDPLRVLMVEDDVDFAEYLSLELRRGDPVTGVPCELHRAGSFADAIEVVADVVVDVVLVDLQLPDSRDVATVLRMLDALPKVPVIVITGSRGEEYADEIIRAGAHDYLVKADLEPAALWRSIRHTMLRHQEYLVRLEVLDERRRLDAELEALSAGEADVTSESLGLTTMSSRARETFEAFAVRYRELLEETLRIRDRGEYHSSTAGIKALARDLGFVRAGPRDVIEIHVSATEAAVAGRRRASNRPVLDAARIQVLELMGQLVAFYRTQALGAGTGPAEHSSTSNGDSQ